MSRSAAGQRRRVPRAHLKTPPLRALLKRLRARAPASAPVSIVFKHGVRFGESLVLGVTSYRVRWRRGKPLPPERFRIEIDSRLPRGEQWEVLIHEWAHVLDRGTRPKPPKDCHDSRWGQCYSRAFRASLP